MKMGTCLRKKTKRTTTKTRKSRAGRPLARHPVV